MAADDLVDKVAFRLYNGETGSFHKGIDELQLVVALRRSQAANALAGILRTKLIQDGYLVEASIDDALFDFGMEEIESQEWPPYAD